MSSTREETALLFGMIQVSANPGEEIAIQSVIEKARAEIAAKH